MRAAERGALAPSVACRRQTREPACGTSHPYKGQGRCGNTPVLLRFMGAARAAETIRMNKEYFEYKYDKFSGFCINIQVCRPAVQLYKYYCKKYLYPV